MDLFAFASLAQIKILLVPVGLIRKSAFEKRIEEIRSFDSISLVDITVEEKDERARFLPTQGPPASNGYLHLSFPSHTSPEIHQPLALFRPSLFPLGVIGIASCSSDSSSNILSQFDETMSELKPQGAIFPLVQGCFAFEDEGGDGSQLSEQISGIEVIPSMDTKKTKMHIGTLLASLCSRILVEFSSLMSSLESPVGNEYLNSGLFATMPPLSEFPFLLDQNPKISDRNSRSDSFQSHNSQSELSGNARKHSLPAVLKRNSTIGTPVSATLRSSTLSVPPPSKKRNSGIGAASSHGRLFKVLGDLFMLAGRTEDAVVWYTESLVVFKSSPDPVWNASVLEGLATLQILDSWASGQGLNSSISNTSKEPWAEIVDKLSQATTMYSKVSPSSDTEHYYSLLSYLYTTSVLRHTSLLFSVWSAKGWGPLAFTTMLHPGPTPYLPPTLAHANQLPYVLFERLSSVSGIRRAQICDTVSQAHGPWLLHLGPRDRIGILEGISGFYGCLGYKRKEAYVLREILGCLMDLIVCGRDQHAENDIGNTRHSGLGIQGASTLPTPSGGMVGVRENELADGNESVMKLIKHVCKIHGINMEVVKVVDLESLTLELQNEDKDSNKRDSSVPIPDEELFPLEPVGWPELQIGIVREAIAIAESLPDFPAVAQCCFSALKTLHPVMTPADQIHLYTTATRALATARRRGDPRSVEYWSGNPVVTIEMTSLSLVRLPIEKDISLLRADRSDTLTGLPGFTDPFLYNPRRTTLSKGYLLVVQNEELEFRVTLKNPFVFDLELSSLSLSTSGIQFVAQPIKVVIPSNSFHAVFITGRALETGSLTVRGCRVQGPDGISREFLLPLSTEEEEDRKSKRKSAMECELGRSKYAGLEAHPWERKVDNRDSHTVKKSNSSGSKSGVRHMEFKVVPELPLMRIRRTSLTHGAVMLYNGEISTIRITLENVSSLLINFLNFTFEDSTIAPAQHTLTEGELSVFEAYETEYSLIHQNVLSCNGKNDKVELPPGKKMTVTVDCFGKAGCTNGTVHISYAHAPSLTTESTAQVFYARQVSCPILVTVYHMLECYDMNIMSYPDFDERTDPGIDGESQGEGLESGKGWCLFSIEVRNTYGLPFEVTFERTDKDSVSASAKCVVAPGSTSRIVLPLHKLLLSNEQSSKPIPTLSERQFVVDKLNLSSTEEKARRELFWYREGLFKCIRGRWQEAGGSRSGDLSLRQQRLTLPMLRALRTDITHVEMDLLQYDSDDEDGAASKPCPTGLRGGKIVTRANQFGYLRTRVTNLSASPLILTASLFFEPSKHIIFQGVLLDIPIGNLESGESHDFVIPVCFVSCGRFELRAEVHILNEPQDEKVAGVGQLTVITRDE